MNRRLGGGEGGKERGVREGGQYLEGPATCCRTQRATGGRYRIKEKSPRRPHCRSNTSASATWLVAWAVRVMLVSMYRSPSMFSWMPRKMRSASPMSSSMLSSRAPSVSLLVLIPDCLCMRRPTPAGHDHQGTRCPVGHCQLQETDHLETHKRARCRHPRVHAFAQTHQDKFLKSSNFRQ